MAKRILLVDDEPLIIKGLKYTLEQEGYETDSAMDGEEALEKFFAQPCDLILLDVEMPVKDGIETLHEIRTQENGVTVPVIFLTANKEKNTVIEGSKLGIMDYIVKPVVGEELIHRIEHVFKKLGMIPVGEKEVLHMIQKVEDYIAEDKILQAASLAEEIAGYQMDEEIAGRMQNVRAKLADGEVEDANKMIQRIFAALERRVGVKRSAVQKIDNNELVTKLLGVEHLINNFKTQEAQSYCKDILEYSMEEAVKKRIQEILECLTAFDDEGTLQKIAGLCSDLKKDAGDL